MIYGRRALEMLCDSNKCFSHKNTYVSFIIVEALNEALVILYAFRVKHVIWRKYNLGDLLLTKDCLCLMNRDDCWSANTEMLRFLSYGYAKLMIFNNTNRMRVVFPK